MTLPELLALGGLPEGSGDLLEGAELSPEEKARVLEMTLAKAGLRPVEKKEKTMMKRRNFGLMLMAGILCAGAVVASAAAWFQMDKDLARELGAKGDQVQGVGGTSIQTSRESEGWTLTVNQAVGDRNCAYLLLDLTAPEGTVLDGDDLQNSIQNMLRSMVSNAIQGHMGEQKHLDADTFQEAVGHFRAMFLAPGELTLSDGELAGYDGDQLTQLVLDRAVGAYERKEREITPPIMRELERVIMLRVVDEYWMDHIDAMTELRQGIGLRAYGQSDPVVEYKREGFEMFE